MPDSAKSSGFTTPANLNQLPAGNSFEAIWSFFNDGTTTWGEGYTLRYLPNGYSFNNGYTKSLFGSSELHPLSEIATPYPVPPQTTMQCRLLLRAPAQEGIYVGHWQLHNAAGQPFGNLRYIRPIVIPSGDLARFVSFRASADVRQLRPQQAIQLQWQIENIGTTTWGDGYQWRFAPALPITAVVPNLAMTPTLRIAWGEVTTTPQLAPRQTTTITLNLTVPEKAGDYATHWQLINPAGQTVGGTFWTRLNVLKPSLWGARAKLQTGMNINPDQLVSNPNQPGRLRGANWVRYPFKAAAKLRTVREALAEYGPLVEQYAQQGIKTLFLLNQETVWGDNPPWIKTGGTWAHYAEQLAQASAEIATYFAPFGENVAYQLWNEGDNPHTPWVSIYLSPSDYAQLCQRVATTLRQASPLSPLIGMGVAVGQEESIAYWVAVRQALQGKWPLDALAAHPYGRWFQHRPFPHWGFGSLDHYLQLFSRALPELPLWITEIGVPGGDKPLQPEEWASVAAYLQDIYRTIAERYVRQVPVVMWFAWSDLMENAGIVQADGTTKTAIETAWHKVIGRYTAL